MKNNNNLPSSDWTGKGGGVVNPGWYLQRTNIDLHSALTYDTGGERGLIEWWDWFMGSSP